MVARKGTNYLSNILYESIDRVDDRETYALKYLTKS
jgi:hypothetical protein